MAKMKRKVTNVVVTLSNGTMAGVYEGEAFTYFEERKRNQFVHVIPAISIAQEVLEKIEALGCKIISVYDLEGAYEEDRGTKEFWVTLEEFKAKSSDYFASSTKRPERSLGLVFWHKSREDMVMVKANADKFCPVCRDYIADREHVCEVGRRGPARDYKQESF